MLPTPKDILYSMDVLKAAMRPTAKSLLRNTNLSMLPTEIRYMVYVWLFPDLHRKVTIELVYFGRWKPQGWLGTFRFYEDVPYLKSQLDSAVVLMKTCHSLRQEVASVVYRNAVFEVYESRYFPEFATTLSPWVKSLIRELRIGMPNKWLDPKSGTTQERLCMDLSYFTGVEQLCIMYCKIPATEEGTGSGWASYHLQALRAFKRACPQLTESHYHLWSSACYATIKLTTTAIERSDFPRLEIDGEYQKWLDRTRKPRKTRKSRQIANTKAVTEATASEPA